MNTKPKSAKPAMSVRVERDPYGLSPQEQAKPASLITTIDNNKVTVSIYSSSPATWRFQARVSNLIDSLQIDEWTPRKTKYGRKEIELLDMLKRNVMTAATELWTGNPNLVRVTSFWKHAG